MTDKEEFMRLIATADADEVLMLECVYLAISTENATARGLTPELLKGLHTRRDFKRVIRHLQEMKQYRQEKGDVPSPAFDKTISFIRDNILEGRAS